MPSQEEIDYYNNIIDQGKDKVDLITVTYNRLNLTKKCLNYINLFTKHPYRLTVVDNGSKDGTDNYLIELKLNHYIDNLILLDDNYGLDYARGTATRHLKGEYCVFFDNDLLAPDLNPDWLTQELELFKKYPEFGAIALRPQVIVGVNEAEIFNATDAEIAPNQHCGATFLMFKTDLIKEVGWANEFTNRVSDWRLGDLLKAKNLKMGWTRNLYCYHMYQDDNWGYPQEVRHFHHPIYPPPSSYERKVNPQTLKPID